MTLQENTPSSNIDKMNAVKAAWDRAASDSKKDSTLKHYQAAEKARKVERDDESIRQRDKSIKALA